MQDRPINFLIIGAAKCATTWLQRSLQNSPDIFMPGPELHFFSREFERGLDWYKAQFADARSQTLLGEKSNSYLTEPVAAERIHAAFPQARLIVQMRDPVERAYSDYCMLFRRGEVSGRVDQYLDPETAANDRFIDHGRYARHIRRFFDFFPPEQILLLFYEDIRTDPVQQLRRVADHLGHQEDLAAPLAEKVKDRTAHMVPLRIRDALRPLRPILDPVRDTKVLRLLREVIAQPIQYPPLSDKTAQNLRRYYERDISDLEDIAGRDLAIWKTEVKRNPARNA